ncbi:DUF6716 putative glycosyltransferase [Nitratireductor aquimarinus]|uniref:DUF6716 putative glycosyltransferase n=1 Tax=Nitratireductor aquimarinus TaxID=889300 RepID=UPI002935A69C|nr:DUF6716 putative glycosyltransferase [Nitratireductor aquimarinus]MDV2968898.1 DUF6716 putative glycosyltransferase [Nitratireductor aquimarinus]
MRALVVASTDSQLKRAYAIARSIIDGVGSIDVVVHPTRSTASQRVVDSIAGQEWQKKPFHAIVRDGCIFNFDIVVVLLLGKEMAEFNIEIRESFTRLSPQRRPIVISGFPGTLYGEYIEHSLPRLGVDYLLTTSTRELKAIRSGLEAAGYDSSSLFLYEQFGPENSTRATSCDTVVDVVTFAVQNVVPLDRERRLYTAVRLLEYAEHFPDRQVVVKVRQTPGEKTRHADRFPFPTLFADIARSRKIPPNLVVSADPMDDILTATQLLLTYSSTAAFEALAHGVKVAIISDLGIAEGLGNHIFIGSGLLKSFDSLLSDEICSPSLDWLRDNGFGNADTGCDLRWQIEDLLEEQRISGRAIDFPYCYAEGSTFFAWSRSPEYERQL